jgi:hypothetical protein
MAGLPDSNSILGHSKLRCSSVARRTGQN